MKEEAKLVGNGRILIVEDDDSIVEILSLMLSDYDFVIAKDGGKAVQLYKIYKPDVVLMDLVLPVMNGIEATKKILETDPDAKIIGVTAFGRKLGKDLLEAGALEIMIKPFRKKDLVGVVEKYLNR
jgi:two-component system response regulator/two-component system chemotaxis response regulator CheY